MWHIGKNIRLHHFYIKFHKNNINQPSKYDGWYFFLINNERGGMLVDENEILEICQSVDDFIAEYLKESIVIGTSYDMLEAHHGILPISRNSFYRKRRIARKIIEKRMVRLEEEENGQFRIVWGTK